MNDLVERLRRESESVRRGYTWLNPLLIEAAEEIERLQDERLRAERIAITLAHSVIDAQKKKAWAAATRAEIEAQAAEARAHAKYGNYNTDSIAREPESGPATAARMSDQS